MLRASWNEIKPVLERWVDDHEDELVDLVQRLVRYPSVGTGLQDGEPYPFGEPCARLAEETKDIVEGYGLVWQNHNYYAVSATYGYPVQSAASANARRPRIAFYSHLDVVPPGSSGWRQPPFEPYVENGWIYGRGSTDNKGPLSSVLFALRFLAEHDIELAHDVTLYGGFDEEVGMDDAKWIVEHLAPSRFNLVSDCSFPVCVAEKGILEIEVTYRLNDDALIDIEAGEAGNAIPDYAYAKVNISASGDIRTRVTRYEAYGKSAHAAFPEGSENAFVALAAMLASNAALSQESREFFSALANLFESFDGSQIGVALHDGFLGDTTCVPTVVRYEDGMLHILVNLRYPAIESSEWMLDRFTHSLNAAGFEIGYVKNSPARPVHENTKLVELLTGIVNEELGSDLEPYAMGGATHARWIPEALGFGPGRKHDGDFPLGAGSGHEANEAVSIQQLKQAIMVYVRAILELDVQ